MPALVTGRAHPQPMLAEGQQHARHVSVIGVVGGRQMHPGAMLLRHLFRLCQVLLQCRSVQRLATPEHSPAASMRRLIGWGEDAGQGGHEVRCWNASRPVACAIGSVVITRASSTCNTSTSGARLGGNQ